MDWKFSDYFITHLNTLSEFLLPKKTLGQKHLVVAIRRLRKNEFPKYAFSFLVGKQLKIDPALQADGLFIIREGFSTACEYLYCLFELAYLSKANGAKQVRFGFESWMSIYQRIISLIIRLRSPGKFRRGTANSLPLHKVA